MHARVCIAAALVAFAFSATDASGADALATVQWLRAGGCGAQLPAPAPLHRSPMLDAAARGWAMQGLTPRAAAERSGYAAQATAGLHITGPDAAATDLLRRSYCRTVTDHVYRDIGMYRLGADTWLLLGAAYVTPDGNQVSLSSARVLQLVNDTRAVGTRCGGKTFAPAPPLRLSDTLASVAMSHASDMAEHGYFEHEDRAGRTPADRVRAVGYRERLVGENIAYGAQSADEVVQGWLASEGHCENIMNPRFSAMGVALAAGRYARHGLYWVQLLVDPL